MFYGEVGCSSGEVGCSSGEVGCSSGEVGCSSGDVCRMFHGDVGRSIVEWNVPL